MITLTTIFLISMAAILTVVLVVVGVAIGIILYKVLVIDGAAERGESPSQTADEDLSGEGEIKETLLPAIPGTVPLHRVDAFLYSVRNYLPKGNSEELKLALLRVPEEKFTAVSMTPLKNPVLVLMFSIFFGLFGIDRFYLGDMDRGILKWILGWMTFGIWPFVDIFLCNSYVKKLNRKTLIESAKAARLEQ